jgi:hypothetical protein
MHVHALPTPLRPALIPQYIPPPRAPRTYVSSLSMRYVPSPSPYSRTLTLVQHSPVIPSSTLAPHSAVPLTHNLLLHALALLATHFHASFFHRGRRNVNSVCRAIVSEGTRTRALRAQSAASWTRAGSGATG